MSPTSPIPEPASSAVNWPARHREWQRRLPRLRLEAEPIAEQVERLRRATIALSVVAGGIGSLFLALFTAFGSPMLGLLIGGMLAGAVITPAWRAFRRIRQGAEQYLIERGAARDAGRGDGTIGGDP